jgi:hypothetical protein
MMEILVRVRDRDGAARGDGRTEPGDVIAVCPQGWRWGRKELSSEEWRVCLVPDGVIDATWTTRQAKRTSDPGERVRAREFYLRLDGLQMIRGDDGRVDLRQMPPEEWMTRKTRRGALAREW